MNFFRLEVVASLGGVEDDGGHDDYDYDEEEDEVDNNVVGMLRNELEEEVTARASPT